ncbi:MAG: hypothetical protein R3212_10840, partial [Xanthomonadales bacterium]|nr:hypothetical protein [Xanthomonadales bacterium]
MLITPLFAVVAAACSVAIPIPVGQQPEPFCSVEGLRFYTDFEGGALHACSQGPVGPVLTIGPEYAPINPSPWYAYRIESDSDREITVTHRYIHGRHRYAPRVGYGDMTWQLLPPENQEVFDNGSFAYRLAVRHRGTWIAAQPVMDPNHMIIWSEELRRRAGLDAAVVATSPGGRRITLYHLEPAESRGWVVLMSRQHPP